MCHTFCTGQMTSHFCAVQKCEVTREGGRGKEEGGKGGRGGRGKGWAQTTFAPYNKLWDKTLVGVSGKGIIIIIISRYPFPTTKTLPPFPSHPVLVVRRRMGDATSATKWFPRQCNVANSMEGFSQRCPASILDVLVK